MPIRLDLCLGVMSIELRHLRAAVAIAEAGSFTAAAHTLHITQPALTRTVQQLETSLGVRLFDRTSRALALTEDGAGFVEKVRVILGDLDSAVALYTNRSLVLGFSWLLPDPWAQQVIDDVETNSRATVVPRRCDDPIAALNNATVDAAVVRRDVPGDEFVQHPLFEEQRIAAVSTASPLATRESIDWAEFGTLPLVINTLSGTTTEDLWPNHDGPVVTCSNFDEWLELIAADRGVGTVPEVARRRVTHRNVQFIPLVGAPPAVVRFVYRRNRATPLLRVLRDAAIRHSPPPGSATVAQHD